MSAHEAVRAGGTLAGTVTTNINREIGVKGKTVVAAARLSSALAARAHAGAQIVQDAPFPASAERIQKEGSMMRIFGHYFPRP
jgi:hypothetical protein